jgi:hypothetical protein
MGVVYRCEDTQTDQQVAVKVVRGVGDDSAQRFDREAALLAHLVHDSIVGHVAHGHADDGAHFLAMEWIDGKTLTHQLDADGLTLSQSAGVVRAVAAAIGHAHDQGIVHRDIKPANILFEGSGLARVKVIDFGIALSASDALRFTASGTILGTPSYMAPEQARSAHGVDARADVFALGCVLYECITGQVAFGGTNPLAVRAKALAMNPVRARDVNPSVPADLDEIVWAMLAKNPSERFADGKAVARALGDIDVPAGGERMHHVVDDQRTQLLCSPSTDQGAADPASLVCVIFAVVPEDMAFLRTATAAELEATRVAMDAIASRHGGRSVPLDGQAYMVVLDGDATPFARARGAASCALAVREAMSHMALVMTCATYSAAAEAVDRGARTMEIAARTALLASEDEPGQIRIDEFSAGLLASEFEVERGGSKTFYLRGRKA